MQPTPDCCICNKPVDENLAPDGTVYWNQGNNPWPYKTDGVCCDACNWRWVVPLRMSMHNELLFGTEQES